jgi:hypothetical protein
MRKSVGQLIDELRKYPRHALAYAYEGDVLGIVVTDIEGLEELGVIDTPQTMPSNTDDRPATEVYAAMGAATRRVMQRDEKNGVDWPWTDTMKKQAMSFESLSASIDGVIKALSVVNTEIEDIKKFARSSYDSSIITQEQYGELFDRIVVIRMGLDDDI